MQHNDRCINQISGNTAMSEARQQFYKTTEQYFLNHTERNPQTKETHSTSQTKKFYIKEGPFINSTNVDYR
ncbi:MAG: hypothetical protein GKR92_11675 [Gammaproteobacteria bacterium]|nr:MAG: hypothetical protein GKR92_11675 [Gammaproteobacteria bacterium]